MLVLTVKSLMAVELFALLSWIFNVLVQWKEVCTSNGMLLTSCWFRSGSPSAAPTERGRIDLVGAAC
jgi:hypothetical protein